MFLIDLVELSFSPRDANNALHAMAVCPSISPSVRLTEHSVYEMNRAGPRLEPWGIGALGHTLEPWGTPAVSVHLTDPDESVFTPDACSETGGDDCATNIRVDAISGNLDDLE